MIKKCWVLMFCAVLLFTGGADAATSEMGPLETLKGPVIEFLKVLNDPFYTNAKNKAAQRDKIWEIAGPIFDFTEISRRAVGKPWLKFSTAEKDQFTEVFSQFLGNTYIDKIQGEYKDIKVDFNKELIKGSKAMVRTRLRRESLEIPIDYRMRNVNGDWKIYDILVENGVSLVKNYRVQFSSILQKETPGQLIERLEKKLAAQKTNSPIK